jgi:putative phosphoribosyl transferase
MLRFHHRTEAGQLLAGKLTAYKDRQDVLVLALPRGGVPVAFEIAKALHVPLDILVVRKLGTPGQEELAMGAITTGGVRVLNSNIVQVMGIPRHVIDSVTAHEQQELRRREHLYRGDRPLPTIQGQTIILVDDGMATGATMRVAATAMKQYQPAHIVIAVPVAAPTTCTELAEEGFEVVTLIRPEPFYAVGFWYEQFTQTSDQEVRDLLEQAWNEHSVTQDKVT